VPQVPDRLPPSGRAQIGQLDGAGNAQWSGAPACPPHDISRIGANPHGWGRRRGGFADEFSGMGDSGPSAGRDSPVGKRSSRRGSVRPGIRWRRPSIRLELDLPLGSFCHWSCLRRSLQEGMPRWAARGARGSRAGRAWNLRVPRKPSRGVQPGKKRGPSQAPAGRITPLRTQAPALC